MTPTLPPDDVLEALLGELEQAASQPRSAAEVAALAARHGVEEQLVRDLLTSLQVLGAESGASFEGLERLGPYQLLEVLGSGGMGRVYRARHPELERDVALKVNHSGSLATPKQRARFLREAEALAALRHPNVVGIHDAGQTAQGGYLVLELVEGARPITDAAAGRDWRGRVELVRDAARGLAYAHDQGVVHRDVKPDNLLVDGGGRVRVSDFGLARLAESQRLTQTGTLLGTLGYMAPEQLRGEVDRQGPHSDVYSLGVVLFELMAERALFPTSDSKLRDLEVRARPQPLPRLRLERPDLPPDLERVWRRALEHDTAARYPNAGEFVTDLDAVLAGQAPPGAPRKGPALPLLIGALALGLLAGAAALGVESQAPALTPSPSASPSLAPTSAPTPEHDPAAPWRRRGETLSTGDEIVAAWRWLAEHPQHPRAGRARALVSGARDAPLCVLAHDPDAQEPAAPWALFTGSHLVTHGSGSLTRWRVPAGERGRSWELPRLHHARRLSSGDWIFSGRGALERWPATALSEGPGPAGRLGTSRPGATWIRPAKGTGGFSQVSPDEALALVGSGASLTLCDLQRGTATRFAGRKGTHVRRFVFTAPNRVVLARSRGQRYTLELWDPRAGKRLLETPALAVSALEFLPETNQLLIGTHRGTLSLHDPLTLEVQRSVGDPALTNAAGSFVFKNDEAVAQIVRLPGANALLALPGQDVPEDDRSLKRVELESGEARALFRLRQPVHSLAVNSEGYLVAVGRLDGRVEVWLLPEPPR